mmetsp:Transcript_75040/g.150854  ORF Transcript_75040/g.150854 Transcript_75040/m.150854 type:complete len:144 (+) Transcript_75040:95-526(+)|eukprot:CAMPEP_0171593328 /NCGR_PEP_ID=MMETSP0990-20121206/42_1 /TAXON_ID=483369 /ORGANISM="non described non described, Strain CCMP2098" /LENGTH=143 /DNA_ID=CAMNT_0012153833 /DNA_START=76 /DNA_END=507 /DNA_ORIENTATION=+
MIYRFLLVCILPLFVGAFHTPLATTRLHQRRSLLSAVTEVSSEAEFDAAITAAGEALVVIDFATTWCGPCKVMLPKFVALSEATPEATFLKVIGDSSPDASKLMKREGVRSVPSFHYWKNGAKVDQVNGANLDAVSVALKKNM